MGKTVIVKGGKNTTERGKRRVKISDERLGISKDVRHNRNGGMRNFR